MVRLVFRPYTQVRRTICTSVPLRASTRISPGFTLLKHSSPSFGSKQICSYSRASQKISGGWCCQLAPWHLILTFISPMGLTPANSHVCLTPWSVFQDGCKKAVSAGSHKPLRPASASRRSFGKPRKINAPSNSDEPDPAFGAERPLLGYNFRTFWGIHPPSLSYGITHLCQLPYLPSQRFQVFWPSFQSSFHLSFTVLVHYRFPIHI